MLIFLPRNIINTGMRIKFINTYSVNLHKSHYIKYAMKFTLHIVFYVMRIIQDVQDVYWLQLIKTCACVRMYVRVCKCRITTRFKSAIINLIEHTYPSEFYNFLAFENFPNFMEPKGSLTHLQQPAIKSCSFVYGTSPAPDMEKAINC